jgi:hypothetical protein
VARVLFRPITTSCRSASIMSINADRARQELPTRVRTEYDLVTPVLSCMASQGFTGQQMDFVHPSRFLFKIRHQWLEARYEAKKQETTFAQFRSDVDSCGIPFFTQTSSVVREATFEPTGSGQEGVEVGFTYRTIEPAGLALKQCMEALGYEIEDRSRHP